MDCIGFDTEHATGDRRYKACRTCRRQKMRCDVLDGDLSCRRCINSGVDCIFETAATRKRHATSVESPKRQKFQALAQDIDSLKAELALLKSGRSPSFTADSRPEKPSSLPRRDGQPNLQANTSSFSTTRAADVANLPYHDLSPDNLGDPISAVHILLHPPVREGEPERNASGWTVENQSRWNRSDPSRLPREDLVARQLIEEGEARSLFNIFMQGCNIWLPIFDPVLDTYDSIREQSIFVFTVILLLGARQQYVDNPTSRVLMACEEEARWLAAESLFKNPSSLETTEAMTILAIYSEKMWFALGHALQMAMDLGLPKVVQDLLEDSGLPHVQSRTRREARYGVRCARTLLAIVQYDRAVAFGTVRLPRMEELGNHILQGLGSIEFSRPSDVTFCASIDLLQICGHLQEQVESSSLQDIEAKLEQWHHKWDAVYEENCVHLQSFQRIQLKMQMQFAKVLQSGRVFVRLLKVGKATESQVGVSSENPRSIGSHILHSTTDLLASIDQSAAFKRLFQFSPTYDGLLITFVVIIGFKLILMYPDLGEMINFANLTEPVATLLKRHPCQKFHQVVRRLIDHAQARNKASESAQRLDAEADIPSVFDEYDLDWTSLWPGTDWAFDMSSEALPDLAD